MNFWGFLRRGIAITAIVVGIALVVAVPVVGLAGFGAAGVVAGSFAASIQGPAVAAGSLFAVCQSIGATATVGTALANVALGSALVAGGSNAF